MPAVSVADSAKVCEPSGEVVAKGLLQVVVAAPSYEHCAEAASVVKVKLTLEVVIVEPSEGPAAILSVGGVVSTVKSVVVEVVLPAWSVAIMAKVCAPSASACEAEPLQVLVAAPSNAHVLVASASIVKAKFVGEEEATEPPAGPEVMVMVGAVLSNVTAEPSETVEPVSPSRLVARMVKGSVPSASLPESV